MKDFPSNECNFERVINMGYKRVVPRDLFNEANLLKCIGKLVLDIEDGKLQWLSYHHDGEAFNIRQNESNGAIYVANVQFFATNTTLVIERPLNSRDAWPLFLETENDCLPVFSEIGEVVLTLDAIKGAL